MKGYKGMSNQMTCRGMQYEVGKTYSVGGEIELCKNGLHFCQRLKDVVRYYPLRNSRYFEVEAGGKIVSKVDKSAARTLTIVREISRKEVNRARYSHVSSAKNQFRVSGYGDGGNYGDGSGYGCGYKGDSNGNGHTCKRMGLGGMLSRVCIGM